MEKIQLQETNKAALNAIGPRKESTQKANLTSFLQVEYYFLIYISTLNIKKCIYYYLKHSSFVCTFAI